MVSTAVPDLCAAAIASAPYGPKFLEPRPRLVNAAINFRSDPLRLSSAGWRLLPENWRSRIMPESMIGRCVRRADLSDACGGEGCMRRRGI